MIDALAQGVHGLIEELELDPLVHNVLGVTMIAMSGLILWSAVAVVFRFVAPESDGAAELDDRSFARNPKAGEQPKLETAMSEHRGIRPGVQVFVELKRHVATGVVQSIVERRFLGVVFIVQLIDADGDAGNTIDVPDAQVHGVDEPFEAPPTHPELTYETEPSASDQVDAIRDAESELAQSQRRQSARKRVGL